MRIPVPMVGVHASGRSQASNNQITRNLYVERTGEGAKARATLLPTPGLTFLSSAGTGPCRSNGIVFNGAAYFISGADLIKIDNNLNFTTVDQLNTNNGWVKMAANPSHIIIVDGTNGYTFDGTTLTVIADADFPTCNHVTFLDSYFIVEDRDNVGRFYISNSNDGTAWDTLDFATAESNPDDMYVPLALNDRLWLFGENTSRPYYNSGNVDFPFDPIRNSQLEWGVQAENSVIKAGNEVFWLARNELGANQIFQGGGQGPKVISNPDIAHELQQMSTTSDCVAHTYMQDDHPFVVFNFPTGDKTFVYDVKEQAWHTRKSKNIGRHRAQGHVFFQGKNIVGDYLNSNFYYYDLSNYTDNEATVERTRYTQFVHKDRQNVAITDFEIEFEPGVGLTSGQGSDPMAMLSVSKDGGKTWSNELWRSIGKKGKYTWRTRWQKLGVGREWQFKISVTDPVFINIIGAYANVEVYDG